MCVFDTGGIENLTNDQLRTVDGPSSFPHRHSIHLRYGRLDQQSTVHTVRGDSRSNDVSKPLVTSGFKTTANKRHCSSAHLQVGNKLLILKGKLTSQIYVHPAHFEYQFVSRNMPSYLEVKNISKVATCIPIHLFYIVILLLSCFMFTCSN